MKKALSLLTSIILLLTSLNITAVAAEETHNSITGTAEDGVYTWNFLTDENASDETTYDLCDEYAELRVSLGSGDSITAEKGIYFSGPGCLEPETSAADSGRYILLRPAYSGAVYIKIQFTNATNSAKGRIWYNDFGTDISFVSTAKGRRNADRQ